MKLHWKQITAAFFLGVALGAGALARNPEKFRHEMLHKFTTKLELTPDQQTQVGEALENARLKMDALRQDFRPKFEEIRQTSRLEIRKLLIPGQQTKFDKMQAEWQSRREKKHLLNYR